MVLLTTLVILFSFGYSLAIFLSSRRKRALPLPAPDDLFFVFRGPEGERLIQVDNWTFVEGDSVPALQVTTSTRCVAGKVVLVASVANTSDEAVSVTVATPYGTKQNVSTAAGKTVAQAFTTRAAAIPAGEVTATPVTGDPVSAQFEAASCG